MTGRFRYILFTAVILLTKEEDRQKGKPTIIPSVYISIASLALVDIDSEHPEIQNRPDIAVAFREMLRFSV
jgi:hypothetical protein